jgi:hypothetical protein
MEAGVEMFVFATCQWAFCEGVAGEGGTTKSLTCETNEDSGTRRKFRNTALRHFEDGEDRRRWGRMGEDGGGGWEEKSVMLEKNLPYITLKMRGKGRKGTNGKVQEH